MTSLTIHDLNEVYVKVDCEPGIGYELRDYFTFNVPGYQFSPLYKARVWDGKIRLWDNRTHTIYRGLVPKIATFCEERNYQWEYENEQYDEEFSLVEAKEFIAKVNPSLDPYDHQIDAFVHAIRTRRALLLSPTSSGKSLIAYLLMFKILASGCKKGLIIVPTVQLVEQLQKDFAQYSTKNGWDVSKYVHPIYAGKEKNSDKVITISTWQSLYKEDPSYFAQYDFVIGDECHLFKSKSLTTIMTSLVNTKYRIGMTGTLDGSKTNKLVLEGLFGSVYVVTTTAELMERKQVAEFDIKCLLLRHNAVDSQAVSKMSYVEEINYIVSNPHRNRFISNLALSLKGNTLIFFQFVEKHGKPLFELINNAAENSGRNVYLIHGDVDVKVREQIREIVETEENAIILASSGTSSTGISIKNLRNIIFASPSKARVKTLQSIGRSLRISETKTEATLFDIADDIRYKKKENYTLKHFIERLRIYHEEKFKYKIYKINMSN